MEVARDAAEMGEGVGEVFEAVDLEVDDFALAFDAAFGEEGHGGVGGLAVLFEYVGTDHQVGRAGFVLQGAEDDAQRAKEQMPFYGFDKFHLLRPNEVRQPLGLSASAGAFHGIYVPAP